jgi:hypothetical protein
MMLGPGGQPLGAPIRIKSKYVCLNCGDVPYVTVNPQFPPGTPECQFLQLPEDGGVSFHCLSCMIKVQRHMFPALVLIADAEQAMTQAAQELLGDTDGGS